MKYNFDIITNRQGTNSYKYDFIGKKGKPSDVLPMWVADMDFPAPPEVLDDIHKVVCHGIFGYTEPSDEYYDAVVNWFSTRFGFHVDRREIVKTPGVVFSLAQTVRAFSNPGEAVLIQTPVYYPFYDIVLDNGRALVTNPLVYDDCLGYSIDFKDFEEKIVEHRVKVFILCNPHNPVGRVWSRADLERLSDICVEHGVIVASDEIHCDFVWKDNKHTCFGLINNDAIISSSPSKTFNLAGLQASNVFVKNPEYRKMLIDEIDCSGYSQLNTIGLAACQSAYTKGAIWLDELKFYLEGNISLAKDYFAANLPKVNLVEPESTYLLWLDFSKYNLSQGELDRRVTYGAKLWLSSGTIFGEDGKGFERINIACPRSVLIRALERLGKEFE